MVRCLPAVLVLCLSLIAFPTSAQDADADGVDDAQELALANDHAPILYFHPREEYYPTSIQYALANSRLERYQSGGAPLLADANPTVPELAAYSVYADPDLNPDAIYYLNNTRGTYLNDSAILNAYEGGSYPDTVYVRVARVGGETVVQYWFYYAFNPGTWNNHEGDWEMIQVVLTGTSPTEVGYSQHESGERMPWDQVDREGTHPKAYVARGSHANFLRSYQGKVGISGDEVSVGGTVWRPGNYTLVNVGELANPTPGNQWIQFAGRWGEFSLPYEVRAESGPPGPAFRQQGSMFTSPITWENGLDVPDGNLLLANWFLANLFLIFLVLVAVSVALSIVRAWRVQRKNHAGVRIWPYAHLRGFNRTTSALVVAVIGMVVGVAGFLLPWYVMTVVADAPDFLVTDGSQDLLRMDGVEGLTVNPLRSDGRVIHVSIIPAPLGLMLAITTALFFLRIVGTKTSRRLGARFIAKGIVTILPFVFVVLLMGMFLPALPGDDPSQVSVDDFLRPIASSPLGGRTTQEFRDGEATLTWGLGLGAILMIASGVLMFVAGFLAISRPYTFFERMPAREPKEPEAVPEPVSTAASAEPVQVAQPADTTPSSAEPAYEPAVAEAPVDPYATSGAEEPPWQQDAPSTPTGDQPLGTLPSSQTCVNCGSPVESTAKTCFYCGLPIV